MNCAEVEILICDYVDGSLAAADRSADRAELERHLAECSSCAERARDAAEAVAFMERAADIEPPQELISRILFDPPWHKQRSGWFGKTWFGRTFHQLLQPRFAMGMALTVLSFAMIMPRVRIQPADLSPAAVWTGIESRVERLWVRTEKFYDNLKFIYQIRATLRDWRQQSQEATDSGKQIPGSRAGKSQTDERRLPGPESFPEQNSVGKP